MAISAASAQRIRMMHAIQSHPGLISCCLIHCLVDLLLSNCDLCLRLRDLVLQLGLSERPLIRLAPEIYDFLLGPHRHLSLRHRAPMTSFGTRTGPCKAWRQNATIR